MSSDKTKDYLEVTPEGDISENNNSGKKDSERFCSICHRPESEAGQLIEMMPGMCVCQDCMKKGMSEFQNAPFDLQSLLQNIPHMTLDLGGFPGFMSGADQQTDKEEAPKFEMETVIPPHKIKAQLDRFVVGQEKAKKVISVAVYNHYKRIIRSDKAKEEAEKKDGRTPYIPDPETEGVEIEKSNILLIGPTGSGKTYLVKTLAKLLNVPLAITDATSLTEAGYIGDDIESVVSKLLAAAGNNVAKAEHGIIFIDEIDKIAKKKNTNQRDVSGEAVQQGMLKLLEGSVIEVPVGASSKNAMVPMKMVDTRNILFICGGAFPALEDIIRERLTEESSMGFHGSLKDKYDRDPNLLSKVTTEDLRSFGMIPEFLGRLPIVATMEDLTEDMLVRILREPRNAILKQYEQLLAMDEVKLTFEDEALRAIAGKAKEKKTGARALRAIIEDFMLDIMYEIPKDDNIGEVIITKAYVEGKGGPKILMRE